jgi:hypothetical protein
VAETIGSFGSTRPSHSEPNVWAWEERNEEVVREVDVEGRSDAQLSQQTTVIVAFEINSVAHLRREVAARANLRKHGADHDTLDLFPGVRGHAVGRGGGDQLAAKRDRPASIEVMHNPGLTEHIAEATQSLRLDSQGSLRLSTRPEFRFGSSAPIATRA